jgi:CheY-like chemotaxis protein
MNSASPSTAAKPPLILCIDDADIALRVRKLLFASEGYNVLTAKSGEDGMELFKQNPVELVISDHFLSAKTGTEIAREMKKLKPEVPILIISAAAEKPDGLEFADGFLMKCEPTQVLLDTVFHLLAKVKAFKDRAREANKNDAGFRESTSAREAKEILGKGAT